ncbi:MAG: Hsp20/alpha crystallin family protein [Marinilabiliaceae bacterium]|nr:Hsp20/alpha crystallin family protein [Marinilabiliaceae bacterium]
MALLKRFENKTPSFPSFFDNWLNRDMMDWMNTNFSDTNTTLPAVNIKENENAFELEVAAPGMNKADFNVSLDNDTLTISSEKKVEKKEEKEGNYTKREFSYQSFQRSFTLPETVVDGDKISAVYENGILKINIPKREEAKPKPSRVIKIN